MREVRVCSVVIHAIIRMTRDISGEKRVAKKVKVACVVYASKRREICIYSFACVYPRLVTHGSEFNRAVVRIYDIGA